MKEIDNKYTPKDGDTIADYILSEIKESEDERIRKTLIKFHKSTIDVDGIKGEDILSWLKRQGEFNKSLYIRFGDIPTNGKSKVYNGEIEIGIEEGISVYPAFEDKEGNIILGLNLPITKTSLYTQQHLLEYDNRPCYLVTGDYVGKGTDGEPLIKNVRIIKEIKPYRIKEDKENNTYVINNTSELEDERIRKELISFVNNDGWKFCKLTKEEKESWIAWLERQGKKSQKTPSEMLEEYFANTPKEQIDKNWEELKHLNNIGPIIETDKSKFEIEKGKWYVCNTSRYTDFIVGKAYYCPKNGMLKPNENEMARYVARDCFHPWTIKDAKDGDILAYVTDEEDLWIMIYQSLYEPYEGHVHYHALLVNDDFSDKGTCCIYIDDLKPATKEQREVLFSKMKKANYEWDNEKKKMRKVEQKPTDNIRLMFHEGDWITDGQLTCKVLGITDKSYELHLYNDDNCHFETDIQSVNKHYHLWSIIDAKDGDVLVSKHNQPFIYNGIFDEESVGAYCGIDSLGDNFLKDNFSCNWSYKEGVKPATKEQHEILFSKMKDAGYEFNFEKKELKKFPNALEECEIEHIEHGKYYYCIKDYYSGGCKRASKGEVVQALRGKSMMALGTEANKYFIPVKCIVGIKPAWCEEDEKMVKDIIAAIDTLYYHGMVNWLKSLKDRVQPQNIWKPSKEQIIALRWVLNNIPYNKHKEEISGLLDQIKIL